MSIVTDAIDAVVAEKAQDFLCTQIRLAQGFSKRVIPDPFGIGDQIRDVQSAILEGTIQCSDGLDKDYVFGAPPPFTGGQCVTPYNVQVTETRLSNGNQTILNYNNLLGPIGQVLEEPLIPSDPPRTQWRLPYNGGESFIQIASAPTDQIQYRYDTTQVTRVDGQPDDCGDQETTGQVDWTYNEFVDIDEGDQIQNYDVEIDYGGDIGLQIVQLPFSNFTMQNTIPIEFTFDVGGVTFEYNDGVTRRLPTDEKRDIYELDLTIEINDKVDDSNDLLEDIKECTCDITPPIEVENAFLPIAVCNGESGEFVGSKQIETLTVLKDSVPPSQVLLFETSADLGVTGCECNNGVAQLNAVELWSDVATEANSVLFSPPIPADVTAIVLQINSYDKSNVRVHKLAGDNVEGYFGWMGISINQFDSSGDEQRIVSLENYFRLPDTTKETRLRVSLQQGVDFTVWDTGERGRLNLPPAI